MVKRQSNRSFELLPGFFIPKLWWLIMAVIIIFQISVVAYFSLIAPPQGSDLLAFLTGGLMVREGLGERLYDLNLQLAFQNQIANKPDNLFLLPFKTLPFFSLIFIPLTLFSFPTSYCLFCFLNLSLIGFFVYLSRKTFTKLNPPPARRLRDPSLGKFSFVVALLRLRRSGDSRVRLGRLATDEMKPPRARRPGVSLNNPDPCCTRVGFIRRISGPAFGRTCVSSSGAKTRGIRLDAVVIKTYWTWLFLAIAFFPNFQTVVYGQISLMILIGYLTLYLMLRSRRFFWAGVASGLLLLKVQFLVFWPLMLLLIKDKKRFLAGFLTTTLGLLGISYLISGPGPLLYYPAYLFSISHQGYGLHHNHMYSLLASLKVFLSSVRPLSFTTLLLINAAVYLLFLCLFFRKRHRLSLETSFIVATLLGIVFSVHFLGHDLAVLLVPLLILFNQLAQNKNQAKKKKGLVTIFLTLWLIPWLVLTGNVAVIPWVFLGMAVFLMRVGMSSGL
jgi:hypothetical protein